MMKAANPGEENRSKWKPPAGYKSAIAKARDAAKATSKPKAKPKAKPRVASLVQDPDEADDLDTASESDFTDGENGDGVFALRRFQPVLRGARASAIPVQKSQICGVNRFEGLEISHSAEADMMEHLNSWAHNVHHAHSKGISKGKSRKARTAEERDIEKACKFVEGNRRPKSQPIVILNNERDVTQASDVIKALPSDRKSLTKAINRVSKRIELAHDERLVMVDSGSFTHAINAGVDLPQHSVVPIGPNERSGDGESACGSVMKRKGRVKTQGSVAGKSLNVKWTVMDVKVPILSVRKLVRDKHSVRFHEDGGYIRNLITGEKLPFFEHMGVYYLIMKIEPPEGTMQSICPDEHVPTSCVNEPVFIRPVP